MKGLQKYSHSDRQRVVEEIIPLIQEKFGENLVALAATASFARNEDFDYSDLELTAFLKEMPEAGRHGGIGKIRDGLLIEVLWTTGENYLEDTRDVTKDWYLAGSDVLVPLINERFIEELNAYQIKNLKEKCLARAGKQWHEVQEATAKVLNAVRADNRENLPLLLFDMIRQMLIVLSFLNQIPYVTFARFITQAKNFEIKPASFQRLIDIIIEGSYQDLQSLEAASVKIFSEFEKIFEELGIELYDENLNLT